MKRISIELDLFADKDGTTQLVFGDELEWEDRIFNLNTDGTVTMKKVFKTNDTNGRIEENNDDPIPVDLGQSLRILLADYERRYNEHYPDDNEDE